MSLNRTLRIAATAVACCGMGLLSFDATPEDIDIFSVDSGNNVQIPNVLFVIDNSANWSRQSQQWPGGEQQGQSEADAIRQVINGLNPNFNVGMMEFSTAGTSNDDDSGFVRFDVRPMTDDNKSTFSTVLTTIYNNITDSTEKRAAGEPFGKIMWDVYNYLAGTTQSNNGAGTPTSADPDAYQTRYSLFASPLSSNFDACRRTVVIFIGNNVATGLTGDSTLTQTALYNIASGGTASTAGTDTSAGTAATTQIPFADYTVTTTPATANIGMSACSTSVTACTSALNATTATGTVCTDMGYTGCSCNSATAVACPSSHWTVVGTNTTTTTTTVSDNNPGVTTNNTYTGGTTTCSKNQPSGGCKLPATTTTTKTNTPAAGQTSTVTTSWSGTCTLVSRGDSCGAGGKSTWEPRANKTVRTVVTQQTSTTTTTTLGNSSACYNDGASCTSVSGGFSCPAGTYNGGCACTATAGTSGCGAGSTSQYMQVGNYNITEAKQLSTFHAAPTGTTTTYMMDEWTRYLRQTGVPIPNGGGARAQVTTYTIDVFRAQQNADFSSLLFNAARVGGGKYFQAKDKNALIDALKQIFNEVQAVNTAFSSASLPVNATNRAQNENQVFIGVFKPDRQTRPLWYGNLKRYQLVSSGTKIDLGDSNGNLAVNPNTGFIADCAVSYWTVDSTFGGIPYWSHNSLADPIPLGGCTTNTTSDLSDAPDGPFVEKGAVAEVIRRGNNPGATPDGLGNYVVNRTIYTTPATPPTSPAVPPVFNTTNTGLASDLVNFIRGQDLRDEDTDANTTEPRSSIHGDVIHSRPQPLNFGGSTGVVVFYGSNDGMYRAVKASTGEELWAFVAKEHYPKLQRLFDNSPSIQYFGTSGTGLLPKDYFFDGSTGVYQTFNTDGTSNTAWIFPSMHRGGRKIYAFDVSTPASPKYMWSRGCDDSTGTCDTGFSAIGQTWSFANVAIIEGYCGSGVTCDSTHPPVPVVVFGGGYDSGDDDNSRSPTAATRGRGVYVVDAQTGSLVKYFDFSSVTGARGVAADVALIDINGDKYVDYAYAADTAGNTYRMDFVDGPTTHAAVASTSWIWSRIAYTNGSSRKFLFTPALVQANATTVYLAIGSGDREHPLIAQYPFGTLGDPSSAVLNRFYVFKDNLGDRDSATVLNLDDTTGNDMIQNPPNSCSATKVTPGDSHKGWVIDLNAQGQGEQTVTSAVIAAGFVFFSTNRPTPDSTTACSTSLGEARGYFLNLLTGSGAIGVAGACGGSRSSTFVGGGLPPSPVLATVPIGGVLRTVVIGAVQKTGEPSSPIESQRVRPPIASDRHPIYWFKSTGDK